MSDKFRDYKSNPTPDTLIRLLRAHQDRVYRLCFQVLRRAHDAEDAAQEVLLKIASGARSIDDPDAFHRWVYRVSLNGALEAARKAARRRAHESRAAMKVPPPPIDEETRRALFEAIANLDDHPRGLLLDHYFEGETLDALASREGVSAQAVSKRLDRAREDLRRALPAFGAVDLSRLFDRGMAPPLVPDLVSAAVLAKVAAVTAKSSTPILALACVLVLVGAASVVAMLRHSISSTAPETDSQSWTKSGILVTTSAAPAESASQAGVAAESMRPPTESLERVPPLRARLDSFKKWWIGIQEDRTIAWADGEKFGAFQKRWDKELWEHVSGLKDLILADPDGFLAFLRDRDHEGLIGDLTRSSLLDQTDQPLVWQRVPFEEYPSSLMRGLLELLQTGTAAQRSATLNLLGGLDDVPQEYKNLYQALLDDPDPGLQRQVIAFIPRLIPMTPALFSKLSALGNNSDDLFTRLRVVSTLAGIEGPESEAFVLHRLVVATHENELFQIPFSLEMRYRRFEHRIQEDQLERAIGDAMARNHHNYALRLMPVALYLSGDRLKRILHQAMAKTAYDWYRERLSKAVERVDEGPYTRDELLKILDPR